MAAIVVGGAVILQPKFDPAGYLRGIERHRATDILCVPTMAVAILEHPDRDKYDLSSPSGRSLRRRTRPRLAVGAGREGLRRRPRSSPATE